LWEGAQKYDGFYWYDRVWKASRYHGDMREPQQLACRAGGVGLAPRTVPWAAEFTGTALGAEFFCGLARPHGLMNSVALPPGCRILCHSPPAAEFTATAPGLPNQLALPSLPIFAATLHA
jgi:hypothetical protein